jgi:hypothetical protein
LEDPEVFPSLHSNLIFCIQAELQPKLPEPYYAASSKRTWIEVSERYVEPDVEVLQRRTAPKPASDARSVATAERTSAEPVVIRVPHDERRENFLEIYTGRRRQRLVTSIEVLRPSNKRTGSEGRTLYLKKQSEVLQSKVHLVEIDFLRTGEHTTAIPLIALKRKVPAFDYHVCIHRFDEFEDHQVYPILMEQALPLIDIPLLPGDGSVSVDLQAAFNQAYDTGPYRREIDYENETPVPALDHARAEWTKQCIVAWNK